MPQTLYARVDPIHTAASAVAGAGLTLVVVAALAGCGQVRAGGTASVSGGSRPSTGTVGGRGSRVPGASHAVAGRAGLSHVGNPRAGRPVCADPAAVTGARVIRIPSLAQMSDGKPMPPQPPRSLPLPGQPPRSLLPPRQLPGIVVGNAAKARKLATVICSLPTMPHAVWQCPIVVGGGYVLEFMSGRLQFHPVIVEASGCEPVLGTGAGGTRSVVRTPWFWTTMARLTGIQAPAHSP